jgi:vitellogenic carboxypeptidase-like protein
MKSTKWMVEALIPQLPVLLYQGQFDIQDGVASSEAWMRTISWEHSPSFWASERRLWKEEGVLAGYIRTHQTLSHVVVAGAGHLAPADQNLRTQRMIEAWISGKLASL